METVGHYAEMRAKLERLHASMRARGASESAISRLPPLPVMARPIELPPVYLATKKDATNVRQQELAREGIKRRKVTLSGKLWTKYEAKSVKLNRRGKNFRGPTPDCDMQRGRAIAGMVARSFGLEPYQIIQATRVRRFGAARKVAVVAVATLMDLSLARIAEVFYVTLSTAKYLLQHGTFLLRTRPDVASQHANALEAIRQRWPEYRER